MRAPILEIRDPVHIILVVATLRSLFIQIGTPSENFAINAQNSFLPIIHPIGPNRYRSPHIDEMQALETIYIDPRRTVANPPKDLTLCRAEYPFDSIFLLNIRQHHDNTKESFIYVIIDSKGVT